MRGSFLFSFSKAICEYRFKSNGPEHWLNFRKEVLKSQHNKTNSGKRGMVHFAKRNFKKVGHQGRDYLFSGIGIAFSLYQTYNTNQTVSLVALFLIVIREISYFFYKLQ
jgi:hypothetical protein